MAGAPLGNQNAKKSRPWRDAIDAALAKDDGKKLRAIAEKLLTLASKGDMTAIRELGDRLDGKAAQAVFLSGELGINKRAADYTDDQLAEIADVGNSANQS